MAKHGKKKLRFYIDDLEFASLFLDFIRKKKFYSRVTGTMKKTGQMEFSIVGSPENVKKGILKIKNLYQKVNEYYMEDENFFQNEDLSNIDGDYLDPDNEYQE
jgi:hypothetical protein